MAFQTLYKQGTIPDKLLITINLNEIQFETNGVNMIVENKIQSFNNIYE